MGTRKDNGKNNPFDQTKTQNMYSNLMNANQNKISKNTNQNNNNELNRNQNFQNSNSEFNKGQMMSPNHITNNSVSTIFKKYSTYISTIVIFILAFLFIILYK